MSLLFGACRSLFVVCGSLLFVVVCCVLSLMVLLLSRAVRCCCLLFDVACWLLALAVYWLLFVVDCCCLSYVDCVLLFWGLRIIACRC